MTKVYAVSSGSYSDYGIDQIFSTIEKAEEYMRIAKEYHYNSWADYNDIEEYDLDPVIIIPNFYKYKYFYDVTVTKEGEFEHTYNVELDILDPTRRRKEHFQLYGDPIWDHSDIFSMKLIRVNVVLRGEVNADTEEQAKAIVEEKRKQLLAENKWDESLDKYESKEV